MKGYMSASGLKTFEDCPRKWWYQYESDEEPVEGDTRYLDQGNAVHEAIEDALASWQMDADAKAIARAHYDELAEKYDVPEDWRDTGREYCLRAIEYTEKQDPSIRGVEVEVPFHIDRADVDIDLKAKIDVATESELWDWKTGSIRDDTPLKEKIQGAVYMAGYRVKYGEPPEAIRFCYLKEEEVHVIEPSDEVWNTMMKRARKLTAAKKRGEFEARPGDKCHWCDYSTSCPEAGGIGGKFEWENWVRL